jgi:hypothetical protein
MQVALDRMVGREPGIGQRRRLDRIEAAERD